MAKVSVVMSVFNGEKYLKQAIESILNQSFGDFEFIIVNDGSTDKSLEILKQYQKRDKRIKIITQENIGLPKSLSKAIAVSKGSYIARQDADDISEPDRLKILAEFLDNHPEVGLVGSLVTQIDKDGHELSKETLLTRSEDIKNRLYTHNCFFHGSVMFRKTLFNKVGGYPTNTIVEDYALWLKMMTYTDLANLPEFLYKWRKYTDSKSGKEIKNGIIQYEHFKAAKQFLLDRISQIEKGSKKRGHNLALYLYKLGDLCYHHRHLADSRKYLIRAILHNPFNFKAYRYFLLSFLGAKFLNKLVEIRNGQTPNV